MNYCIYFGGLSCWQGWGSVTPGSTQETPPFPSRMRRETVKAVRRAMFVVRGMRERAALRKSLKRFNWCGRNSLHSLTVSLELMLLPCNLFIIGEGEFTFSVTFPFGFPWDFFLVYSFGFYLNVLTIMLGFLCFGLIAEIFSNSPTVKKNNTDNNTIKIQVQLF